MLVAQVPLVPAYAETAPPAPQVVSENSVIAQTFKAYPSGGERLSKQIVGLITTNPKLAPDLVIYMRNSSGLNRAQKLAAEHGLAAAADQLRIKAADMGIITKDTRPPVIEDDPWLIALGLLAVGAAICAAGACSSSPSGPVLPPSLNQI
jgi:hypothetical protein